jgi:hypothetical protein
MAELLLGSTSIQNSTPISLHSFLLNFMNMQAEIVHAGRSHTYTILHMLANLKANQLSILGRDVSKGVATTNI